MASPYATELSPNFSSKSNDRKQSLFECPKSCHDSSIEADEQFTFDIYRNKTASALRLRSKSPLSNHAASVVLMSSPERSEKSALSRYRRKDKTSPQFSFYTGEGDGSEEYGNKDSELQLNRSHSQITNNSLSEARQGHKLHKTLSKRSHRREVDRGLVGGILFTDDSSKLRGNRDTNVSRKDGNGDDVNVNKKGDKKSDRNKAARSSSDTGDSVSVGRGIFNCFCAMFYIYVVLTIVKLICSIASSTIRRGHYEIDEKCGKRGWFFF